MISHSERLRAILDGETPDRPAVALWRHFPVDDQEPHSLAAATLQFQQTFDFDLVKVTPASSFCLKDWGVEDRWAGNHEGTRDYTKAVIADPADWERLPILDPSAPHLSAQLTALRLIRQALGPDVPLLQTVFSALAQAKNLAGGNRLLGHIREHPDAVLKGISAIVETTRRFVEASLEAGADGIFYAVQHAQANLLSLEEYRTFGLPYDLEVLSPAREAWCNMLHLHGRDIHFELAGEYPVQIVNWHDRETAPSLSTARGLFAGVTCGGLRQDTLVFGNASQVMEEAADAVAQTDARRHILSTGCVVPIIAPYGNVLAARQSVEPSFHGIGGKGVTL